MHNSQVLLKGIETEGYIIVSAGRAQILSCEHQPIWHDRQLKTKTTWMGSVEHMQVGLGKHVKILFVSLFVCLFINLLFVGLVIYLFI